MIQVTYAQNGNHHQLSITGHAGYSQRGNDIVCAGVSAIAYTLLGFLENSRDDVEELASATASGELSVSCTGGVRAGMAFEMALIGLMQIANQYHDNVKIHITVPDGDSRE